MNVKEEVTLFLNGQQTIFKKFFIDYGNNAVAVEPFGGLDKDERMAISRFIKQAKLEKRNICPGKFRDFTYIDDCVKIFDLNFSKKF